MKRTFTTTMPDQVGAFLLADRCLTGLGLNITRVSYNKAVDTHMLFLEVDGDPETLDKAEWELARLGYLQNELGAGQVLLLEFQLKDEPGSLYPVLKLIHAFHFNISYISSQENGTDYQYFKMGLFVDDGREISDFMRQVALLCPVRVLEYDKSEKILDNTVFYLNFANDISQKMGFDEDKKRQFIVQSNKIMQVLEERNSPPYKTFEYIGKFADCIRHYKGEDFCPRVTRQVLEAGTVLTLIEPPCGSNLCFLDAGGDTPLVCVDGGFACYTDEMLPLVHRLFADWDNRQRVLLLTHGDVDHCGLADHFDVVYGSGRCLENFQHEQQGLPAIREENPLHEPYVRISKLLTAYRTPDTAHFCAFSAPKGEGALSDGVSLDIGPFHFTAYEGSGGHVAGEVIYLEEAHHLAFSGDIFVNLKGFTPEQAQFNRLAPYLMTSVDTDPALAKGEREAFQRLLTPGSWHICGGHGALLTLDIE